MSEFASAGFTKARLESIAQGAGVTKGLLYYYFEDREDLLTSLYAEINELLVSLVGPLPAKPTPDQFWSWIERIYRNVLERVAREPVMMAFLARIMTEVTSGIVPPGFEKHKQGTQSGVMKVVKLGQSCGAVRQDLPLPLLLRALMNLMGACDGWIAAEAKAGKLSPATVDAVLRLYRSAFAAPVVPSRPTAPRGRGRAAGAKS